MDQSAEVIQSNPSPDQVMTTWMEAIHPKEAEAKKSLAQKLVGSERFSNLRDLAFSAAQTIRQTIPNRTTLGFLALMAGATFLAGKEQLGNLANTLPHPQPITAESSAHLASLEKSPNYPQLKEFLYANHTPEERQLAEQRVQTEIDNFQAIRKFPGGEILYQQKIQDTLKWSELVAQTLQDPRLNIPDEDKLTWQEYILSEIFTESGGKDDANPGKTQAEKEFNGKGLLQVRELAAQQAAKELKMESYDLFNPSDNLLIGTHILEKLYKLFGENQDLASTTYYGGEGAGARAIYRHAISDLKIPISKVDADFDNPNIPATEKYGKKMNTTSLDTPAVNAELKSKKLWDEHLFRYTYMIKAAASVVFNQGEID